MTRRRVASTIDRSTSTQGDDFHQFTTNPLVTLCLENGQGLGLSEAREIGGFKGVKRLSHAASVVIMDKTNGDGSGEGGSPRMSAIPDSETGQGPVASLKPRDQGTDQEEHTGERGQGFGCEVNDMRRDLAQRVADDTVGDRSTGFESDSLKNDVHANTFQHLGDKTATGAKDQGHLR